VFSVVVRLSRHPWFTFGDIHGELDQVLLKFAAEEYGLIFSPPENRGRKI